MFSQWLIWKAFFSIARLGTVSQILLYLPLTLSTLSTSAFLILSLFLTLHSLIHSTLSLILPSQIFLTLLPFLQLPVHPFLLLLSFNLFSNPLKAHVQYLIKVAGWWGTLLRWWTPVYFGMEGLSSLVVSQNIGRKGRAWAESSEGRQFALLVCAAAAYVGAAWWIVVTYPSAATTPLSSTLFGAALTALTFLTLIGFALRRTNVIESAAMTLYFAYNVWLCSEASESDSQWLDFSSTYAPLLSNLLPHLQSLISFIKHTLPKSLLVALVYRLTILHFASRVLPTIGGDSWDDEDGVHGGWDGRPSSKVTMLLLTYRQTFLVTVYSHLLLLDHSSQVWWRWTNVLFTLAVWAVEILLTNEDDELVGEKWKEE